MKKTTRNLNVETYYHILDAFEPARVHGRVSKVVGLVVEAEGPVTQLGSVCDIICQEGGRKIRAEVLGFRDNRVLLMPLEEVNGISPGCRVIAGKEKALLPVGSGFLGRVVDGLGRPIDGKGPIVPEAEYPLYTAPVNPLCRCRITQPLDLGVRAINGLLTIGRGQRMGIFSGSGVGKSILLGMIARHTNADCNVIALIGERGREVNEFIDKELGTPGLEKSVVVVATSDHLPLIRVRGAFTATAIAEYLRDRGMHVNLMMDSVTRFATAQREIGLALGEPPASKGYTPSVFTMLPRLLERAGAIQGCGTITGLYTVLVEGDDFNEPIADAVRSILDGHLVLTRELAIQNHYPAIDVLNSVSRVMNDIADDAHLNQARQLKKILATYRRNEDLIKIGAYTAGSSPDIDYAIEKYKDINQYLTQAIDERASLADSIQGLAAILEPETSPRLSMAATS
jgi:flagellum-specific ATP synthase